MSSNGKITEERAALQLTTLIQNESTIYNKLINLVLHQAYNQVCLGFKPTFAFNVDVFFCHSEANNSTTQFVDKLISQLIKVAVEVQD